MVARMNGVHEVASSILVTQTIENKGLMSITNRISTEKNKEKVRESF